MATASELTEFSSDAALAIDSESRVVAWNHKAEQLFGYSATEVVGKHCGDVLRTALHQGEPLCVPDCEIFSCFLNRQPFGTDDCRIRRKDGGWLTARTQTDIAAFDQRFNPVEVVEEAGRVAANPLWGTTNIAGKVMNKIRGIENTRVAEQVAEIIFGGSGARTSSGQWARAGTRGGRVEPQMEGIAIAGADRQKNAFDKLLTTAKDLSDKDRWLVRSIMSGLAATSGQTGGLLPHTLAEGDRGGLPGLLTAGSRRAAGRRRASVTR